MDEKELDIKFIQGFVKIKMNKICNELGLLQQNVVTGKTTSENLKKVRTKIQQEIAKLYL